MSRLRQRCRTQHKSTAKDAFKPENCGGLHAGLTKILLHINRLLIDTYPLASFHTVVQMLLEACLPESSFPTGSNLFCRTSRRTQFHTGFCPGVSCESTM